MKSAKATQALRSLCQLGLPAEQFIPALLESLHAVVPSDRNLFDWTDDRAQLVRYFFEGPIDTNIARLYFDEFHNRREVEAMAPFQDLARTPAGVREAKDLAHAGFYESALYHEIWKPQGLHTRIEAVLRARCGRLLGSLVLYRGPREPAFGTHYEARLAQLLPEIADAITACGPAQLDEPFLPAPGLPETLLLTADGQVCHASPGAQALLLMCEGGVSRDRLSRPLAELARGVLPLLAGELTRTSDSPGAPRFISRIHATAGGPLQAHATRLAPQQPGLPPLVQVTLRRMEPQRLALDRALRSLPLTPGQAAVCRELFHGASQAEVSAHLGVGLATVVDHVRKAYATLGLRSAPELRALLDRQMLGRH